MQEPKQPPAPDTGPKAKPITIRNARFIPGFALGFTYPSLLVRLVFGRDCAPRAEDLARFDAGLADHLPAPHAERIAAAPRALGPGALHRLAHLAIALQDSAGLPVPAEIHMRRREDSWLLAFPAPSLRAGHLALAAASSFLAGACAPKPGPGAAALNAALDALSKLAEPGTNTHHFQREAQKRGIPALRLLPGLFQYGWGQNGRIFKSSLTEATPSIGTAIARDKRQCNALLRMAGLPVARQKQVADLDGALKAAGEFGYPVAIKPADLDQGKGVEAGLASEEELRAAFARTSRAGRAILIETHAPGADLRCNIIGGTFYSAVLRHPASVTGDGVRSVAELIEAANRDPRRSTRRFSVMKPLTLNEEARELLERHGLGPDAVPVEGQIVRLRRSANVTSGGVTQNVTDAIHPDNAALCERAARLLRLDIAGVDLITPDYRRSWKEVPAIICEINAQPQIGLTVPEVFGHIFETVLPAQNRIPATLVQTDSPDCAAAIAGRVRALPSQARPALVSLPPLAGTVDAPGSVRAVLLDPDATGLIVLADGAEFLRDGLPLDRFDRLWIGAWRGDAAGLQQRLQMILPHIRTELTVLEDHAGALRLDAIERPGLQLRRCDTATALRALERDITV
ncbi:hypothetical protein [Marivita sp. GX14005]|uniref:ATP-binding protein n=1 Tax=Marivita sp. GX14005 TaxID=2942276 RepID=UPI002019AD7E|nr:hypothetical protein [Marivita sp. GX14005]MCL3883945.1 hypothetical protein [Marivita sp. GX14005]